MTTLKCRHCNRGRVNRPRGLCWGCYYTPGVKDQYPPTGMAARRLGNFAGQSLPLGTPTTVAPATPEKLAVMEERARLKQCLWHPLDAKFPGDPTPVAWLAANKEEGK